MTSVRPPELDKSLKCFLLHRYDPFLLVAPFKIEFKSMEPFIYKCHDFYSYSAVSYTHLPLPTNREV